MKSAVACIWLLVVAVRGPAFSWGYHGHEVTGSVADQLLTSAPRRRQSTDGYQFSQYETLRTIELYANSKFTSGPTDSLGRQKPFYNICKFRVNVAVRATDLDTKHVQIQADRTTKTSYAESFLLNLKNRTWMRETHFAPFLNRMGQTRAKYGGILAKKTESDGEMKLHVVPWLDAVTDQVDIRNGGKPPPSCW